MQSVSIGTLRWRPVRFVKIGPLMAQHNPQGVLKVAEVAAFGQPGEAHDGARALVVGSESYCCTGLRCSLQPQIKQMLSQCEDTPRNAAKQGSASSADSYLQSLHQPNAWAQNLAASDIGSWATAYGTNGQLGKARMAVDGDLSTFWSTFWPREEPAVLQVDLLKYTHIGHIVVVFGNAARSYNVAVDTGGGAETWQELASVRAARCTSTRSDSHQVKSVLRTVRITFNEACGKEIAVAEVRTVPTQPEECQLPVQCIVALAEAVHVEQTKLQGNVDVNSCRLAWEEATNLVGGTPREGVEVDAKATQPCAGATIEGEKAFDAQSFVNCRAQVFNAYPHYNLCSAPS